MKMLRTLIAFVALFVLAAPAAAQWQTQNHSVPLGRGAGNTGFGSAAPNTAGIPLTSTGPNSDPTFNNQLSTGAYAPNSVGYGNIQQESAGTFLCNPTGGVANISECTPGVGLKFTGTQLVNTVPASFSGVAGLVIANDASTPNTQIDVTAAQLAVNNAGSLIYVTNASVAISLATTGANALDTGTRAANTWYNVFLIYNGTTVSGLASLSASAPTLPGGYTFFVRVGAMRTDGSSNLLRTKQIGQITKYLTSSVNLPSIVASNVGTTFLSQSVSNFVPPTASSIFVRLATQTNGVGPSYCGVAPYQAGTLPNTQPYAVLQFGTNGNQVIFGMGAEELILESTNIFYAATAMTVCDLAALGWRDAVNAN